MKTIGFIDAGALAEGWRFDNGQPAYGAPLHFSRSKSHLHPRHGAGASSH